MLAGRYYMQHFLRQGVAQGGMEGMKDDCSISAM